MTPIARKADLGTKRPEPITAPPTSGARRVAWLASTSSGFLSVTDLVNSMKGNGHTNGWDIACAYDAQKLNQVLANLYSQAGSKIVKTITLGSQDDPYTESYTIVVVPNAFKGLTLSITENYTFGLQSPSLQFQATPNVAVLNMPIQSASVQTTDATLKLLDPQPTNASELTEPNLWYKLVGGTFQPATVAEVDTAIGNDPLATQFYRRAESPALDGKTDFQNKVYQLVNIVQEAANSPLDGGPGAYSLTALVPLVSVTGDGASQSGDGVVTFNTAGSSANVVLHFQTGAGSGTTFGLTQGGVNAYPTLLKTAPDLLERLQNYFAQNVSDVDYTLTTVQAQATATAGAVVTPKSFRFATQQRGTDASLTIFIQTQESGLPPGGNNLTFQDANNQPFLPVSSQASTTLIFSRAFMSRYYLVQGLAKQNFTGVTNVGTDDQPVEVSGNYNINLQIAITGIDVSGYDSVTVDPLSVGQLPVTLLFDAEDNLHVSSSFTASTNIYLTWTTVAPCYAHTNHDTESATITVSLAKTAPLTWSPSTAGLALSFGIDHADYTVTVDSSISTKCSSSTKDQVDQEIQNQVAAALPTISIPMDSLSAIAEVNLLFSGQQLFANDKTLGVFAPQDVVMFGNI